jgi:hypothetical protein
VEVRGCLGGDDETGTRNQIDTLYQTKTMYTAPQRILWALVCTAVKPATHINSSFHLLFPFPANVLTCTFPSPWLHTLPLKGRIEACAWDFAHGH